MKTTGDASGAEHDTVEMEVAPVSYLIARGLHVDDPRVSGPGGHPLGVGDRCPREVSDNGMVAHVEVGEDGAKAYLFLRDDDWGKWEWAGFAGIPNVVTLLATPPLAWFLVEWSGAYARAPVALNLDAGQWRAIRSRLKRSDSLKNTVTLFGVSGDTIRAVKVGIALGRVWTMLDVAAAATPFGLGTDAYIRTAQEVSRTDPGVMFAAAMTEHLKPHAA